MKKIYKEQLFEQGFLVSDGEPDVTVELRDSQALDALFSFASLFSIRICSGENLACADMIPFVAEQLGENVPEPFYRGFPDSVRQLSSAELFFDQILHYAQTYGCGYFDEPGHSIVEPFLMRTALKERTSIRNFAIITEAEAQEKFADIIRHLLTSSRPLNEKQYSVLLEYVNDFDCKIDNCASKDTAIRLLTDTRNLEFVSFIALSDVIKLVDNINFRKYGNDNVKKLNLRNQDRKFIAAVMDRLFLAGKCDVKTCCEKKSVWNGLLHHIHYQPENEKASQFVACMRGKENLSAYAQFEDCLKKKEIKKAVKVLREEKGTSAILRNLDYLLSRCSTKDEVKFVLENIESNNVIVQLQLLSRYSDNELEQRENRNFIFTAHNRIKVHHETDLEAEKRKSIVPEEYLPVVRDRIYENLRNALKERLGKVYIDENMRGIALPLQETASQGGFGVLPKGSRIRIKSGKKIRAFTYWEKVRDIDLSVIGIGKNGLQREFSWRTMSAIQSDAITFSGDQTSGYYGGSEYFDLDIRKFQNLYPDIRYLVFCDNIFTRGTKFDQCFCKAGYMIRDIDDSGQVFEPKTVQSSYIVNCKSTFAYLFGIDLATDEFVWLNAARQGEAAIAGETSLGFLQRYFNVTAVIDMYTFFEMMAFERVDLPSEADVIVSDAQITGCNENAEVIRSCDFDKVLALMNA